MENMEQDKSRININCHIGICMFFAAYVVITIYFLLFAEETGRNVATENYNYNLIPFKEIIRFWEYRETLGISALMLNIFGNIACLVPMGILLPVIRKNFRKIWITTFTAFCFSLIMELMQLLTKVGSFDVDDLILNTLGGFAGYIIYKIFKRITHKKEQ